MKKKQQAQKINWWVLILIILLALLLIFSRSRRAVRRVSPAAVPANEYFAQLRDTTSNPEPDMIENKLPLVTAALLLGKTDPASDKRFTLIDGTYASRSGMYLQTQALDAFVQMHQAALKEGVRLTIISAMRTFEHQRRIWNGKWNGNTLLHGSILASDIPDPLERAREILRFSAMPGTSRHHWGTDIDLNSLQNSYFLSGEGKKVYDWLQENAWQYGFFQPYTAHGNGRAGGYEEEKWHWSYFPLSDVYLKEYSRLVSYRDIQGFEGWETAPEIDVLKNYVMQISKPREGRKAGE